MGIRVLLGIILIGVVAVPCRAFHEPGASQCSGCHLTSDDTDSQNAQSASDNPHLLKSASASDVCLSCHATGLGAVFAHDVRNPSPEKGGGNFIYLLEDNLNDTPAGEGGLLWIPGDAAGHNINAPEHGIKTDATLSVAPGGDYPADLMSCTSCHDPHGNDNFRLLRGAGSIDESGIPFVNDAPDAEGISLYAGAESNSNHTAYHSGVSEWCANCHGQFHNASYPSVRKHPTGASLGATIAAAYNAYNGTSDPYGAASSFAYLAEVPFEDPSPTNTTTSTAGPSSSSTVMCLTCHRAHASSAADAGRWDFAITFLSDDGRESGSHPLHNPYDANQRSLCNKCHVKDANDAAFVVNQN